MGVELVKADVDWATATDITEDELAALVAGNTDFALDLFRAAAEDNTLVSPYSVAAALTMTYAGARADTAEEMRSTLRLGLPDDRLHPARNELDRRIAEVAPSPVEEDDRAPFTIEVANSLWGQAGYPFADEFLALLAESYDAGMSLVDFAAAAEEARQAINAQVEEETRGRIVDLIPEGIIDELTRMVLVNAIWFQANWAAPFDPELTADGPFTLLDATEVTVPVMHAEGRRMHYAEGDGYQAVRLPYAGDAAMWVILPEAGGFEEVVAGLDRGALDSIRRTEDERLVDLAMPRFEFRSEFALKPALEELGMVTAFLPPTEGGGADFTGMTEARELFVKEVVHQAFITVDEQGTEAAAATASVMQIVSAPMPATVTIDRPFLFLIEHAPTGEILFLGQVTDPS